jgi:hypothetical protein
MKKHTFPEEQPEMPVHPERPEIRQPDDPKVSEIPKEGSEEIPEELPPIKKPDEKPPSE